MLVCRCERTTIPLASVYRSLAAFALNSHADASQVVGEALKGATLVAYVMSKLGYACNPPAGTLRTDIIQAVRLGSREKVLAFCEAVQRCSPVGAHIRPVAGRTPGYGDEVTPCLTRIFQPTRS